MVDQGFSKKLNAHKFLPFFDCLFLFAPYDCPVMKNSSPRKLVVATLAVLGFAAVLPVSAARASRPPATPTPPVAVSGM